MGRYKNNSWRFPKISQIIVKNISAHLVKLLHVVMMPVIVHGNNKGADLTAHLRSLLSVFVIRILERLIAQPDEHRGSILLLASVAQELGLSFILS